MAKSFDALVKRTTSHETRKRAAQRSRELLGEMLVGELRLLIGKSQADLARELGITQPSVSKLEKQSDMQVSTLQRIVEALGGKLEIVANFPSGAVRIRRGTPSSRAPVRRKAQASRARRPNATRA
jgi:transcriptional regulator with XRE-family HTH domain